MGHMIDEGSLACAWMHSAGVRQMLGYIVPTWYGYGGWGVHKYFTRLPGWFSFAEAFYANMQALLFQLSTLNVDSTDVFTDIAEKLTSAGSVPGSGGVPVASITQSTTTTAAAPTAAPAVPPVPQPFLPARDTAPPPLPESDAFETAIRAIYRTLYGTDTQVDAAGMTRTSLGLLYDRDNVVFYGDPAWNARLLSGPCPYTITFTELPSCEPNNSSNDTMDAGHSSCSAGGAGAGATIRWEVSVTVTAACTDMRWDAPTPDDKQCVPGRPPLAFLPRRVRSATVRRAWVSGSRGGDGGDGDVKVVATHMFVLFGLTGPCTQGDTISAVVEATL